MSKVSAEAIRKALTATYSDISILELDSSIFDALTRSKVDVVFPALHGPPGEDGTVQGFLEILGIPYVGSGVLASACAMNKIVAKQIFRAHGLPVVRDVIVQRSEGVKAALEEIVGSLGSDVVIKPSQQGSALGVSFARDEAGIENALQLAFSFDEQVLVEQRVVGKEITVAILEREQVEALPVVEVKTPAGSWYDYEHRYTQGLSEHVIPASLGEHQMKRTQEVARLAHIALGCRDLSRADFVVPDEGEPALLEVNTLPGMTPTSLYPDAAKAAGLSFEDLVAYLVARALSRSRGTYVGHSS